MPPSASVAVYGAGIAGLTVAHELVERGLAVTVYEAASAIGGRAASGRRAADGLPTEHGFRHFPWFYRHLDDQLARIPDASGRASVLEHLVPCSGMPVCTTTRAPLALPTSPDTPWSDRLAALRDLVGAMPPSELAGFAARLLLVATSCDARRETELEATAWWDFIGAGRASALHRAFLAQGLTRSLAAMRAEESSTRTVARILLQLLAGIVAVPGGATRVLDGPTSDVWLAPWRAHLAERGVRFHPSASVERLVPGPGHLESARVRVRKRLRRVEADAHVLAVPVQVAAELLSGDVAAVCPAVRGLPRLRTAWMSGLQLYLARPAGGPAGHWLLVDSPWALTAVVQSRYWAEGTGSDGVATVLSLIVSDWTTPGRLTGKPARDCDDDELLAEVLVDLEHHGVPCGAPLRREHVVGFHVDEAVAGPPPRDSRMPMLLNTAGSWAQRPTSDPGLRGLVLAGDYVRTNTDLACMEAACESGRRAANVVLERLAAHAPPVPIHPLAEPAVLDPLKALDARRHAAGRPHLLARLLRSAGSAT